MELKRNQPEQENPLVYYAWNIQFCLIFNEYDVFPTNGKTHGYA
mgnify:CR=1 FL=1